MKTYNPILSLMRRFTLALFVLAGFPALPASAQTVVDVTITTSATAPFENISSSYALTDASNANKNISGWAWRNNNTADGLRNLGQRFVAAENAVIDKITVLTLNKSGDGTLNAGFTLTLYSFTKTTSDGIVDQTLLTATGAMPDTSIATDTWLTFNLSSGVALKQGISYGFILHFDEAADNRSITLQQAENAAVSGLYRIQNTDGSSSTSFSTANTSLIFYVQTATVPEPSICALLSGVGGVAFALVRRRRLNRS
jgi:hypothetical protein